MVKPPPLSHLAAPSLPPFDIFRNRSKDKHRSGLSSKHGAAKTIGGENKYTSEVSSPPKSPAKSTKSPFTCITSPSSARSDSRANWTPFGSTCDSRSFQSCSPYSSIISTGTTGLYSSSFERVPGGWRPLQEEESLDPEPWSWPRLLSKKRQARRGAWGLEKLGQRQAFHKGAHKSGDLTFVHVEALASSQHSASNHSSSASAATKRERRESHARELPGGAPGVAGVISGRLQSVTEDGNTDDSASPALSSDARRGGTPQEVQADHASRAQDFRSNGSTRSSQSSDFRSNGSTSHSARVSQSEFRSNGSTTLSTPRISQQDFRSNGSASLSRSKNELAGVDEQSDNESDGSEVFDGSVGLSDLQDRSITRSATKTGELPKSKSLEVDFSQFASLGFTHEELTEFHDLFNEFDADKGGAISVNELRAMLRNLGYPATPRMIYDWVLQVDKDRSGELEFKEFVQLMNLLTLEEMGNCQEHFSFYDEDGSGDVSTSELRPLLIKLGYQPTLAMVSELMLEYDSDGSGTVNFEEFLQITKKYRSMEKAEIRKRAGFSEEEVYAFQESFNMYDRDRSGSVSKAELMRIVQDMNLTPTTREQQKKLELMIEESDKDGSGTLEFFEFLTLMRKFLDLSECEEYNKERRAAEECGFDDAEVSELRQIFESLLQDGSNAQELTIVSIKQLLRRLGASLTPAQMQELKLTFDKFAQQAGDKSASVLPFPKFLLLMKDMMNKDFCGLKEASKRTIDRRATEQKNMEQMMLRIQEQKNTRKSARGTQVHVPVFVEVVEHIPCTKKSDEEEFKSWFGEQTQKLQKRKEAFVKYRETEARNRLVWARGGYWRASWEPDFADDREKRDKDGAGRSRLSSVDSNGRASSTSASRFGSQASMSPAPATAGRRRSRLGGGDSEADGFGKAQSAKFGSQSGASPSSGGGRRRSRLASRDAEADGGKFGSQAGRSPSRHGSDHDATRFGSGTPRAGASKTSPLS